MWSRIARDFEGDPRRSDLAVALLARLACVSLFVLVAATWPLWSPDKSPRVPLVGFLAGISGWLGGWPLAAFGLSAVAATICGLRLRIGRWSLVTAAVAVSLLVLADQQRLQPWAYQLIVLSIVLVGLPAREAIALARLLVASIYFFSALSKLDRSFFDSGGGQVVDGLLCSLGLAANIGVRGRMLLAGGFAMGELLIAAGLCWRRTRRFAWPASIVMHLLLLLALGPWGADNKPGVLIWNVYFILQNVVLFGVAGERPVVAVEPLPDDQQLTRMRWLVRCLATFVIAFPLTEPLGICDVWPAWAVYATGPERMRLLIESADREKLSAATREYVEPPRFEDDLCLVRIDRLSLDAFNAPLYPQNRFRLGLALAIAENLDLEDRIVVEVETAADRLTGSRATRQIRGRAAIVAELQRYWLNGTPRPNRDKPGPIVPAKWPSFSLSNATATFDGR